MKSYKMSKSWCHCLLFHVTVVVCLSVCAGVHITRLDVPPLVELGSQEAVLDCEYNFENKNSNGLVVKWFFNNKSNPVYQWIHKQPPQDVGPFKGKLDLGYKASQDSLHSHRALKILNPGANMTGNYICVVSTFDDEDYKSNSMLVFTPGKNFQLNHEKKDGDSVKLVCLAEDVYPQPTLTITSPSNVIKEVKTDVELGADGLFDIIGTTVVKDSDLEDQEDFVCQMMVSQANYVASKQFTYHPGVMPTAQLTAAVDNALEVHGPGSGSSTPLNENRAVFIFLTFICLLMSYIINFN